MRGTGNGKLTVKNRRITEKWNKRGEKGMYRWKVKGNNSLGKKRGERRGKFDGKLNVLLKEK